MQHYISLLTEGLEIIEPFPVNKVFGAGYAGCSRSGGGVERFGLIMPLDAEDTVNLAVLMTREPHVIDVRCGCVIAVGHGDKTRHLQNGGSADICYHIEPNTYNGVTNIQMVVVDMCTT